MPHQNRVTPYGDLIATPARGTLFGNRGCLHDADGRVVRWAAGSRWIACRLEFKGRRRPLLTPGRYTELFFLDEATALAAGHRPCVECRRDDFIAFRDAYVAGNALATAIGAADLDRLLDPERPRPGASSRAPHLARDLPDGTMVELDAAPHLLLGERAYRWTPFGYASPRARPTPAETVRLLTSPSIVAALRAGYRPAVASRGGPDGRLVAEAVVEAARQPAVGLHGEPTG